MDLDLTIIILTKDEEKNIEKCLKSIKDIATNIVIVDSGSTDKTKEICEKYNADFYYNPWINHATQFNWALTNIEIKTKWIMRMDADEEIMPELELEIKSKMKLLSEEVNGVILKRRVYFMGRWIKHGGIYPIKLLRIFRRGFGISEQREMDEHLVVLSGKVVEFENDFIDYNNKNLEWWINKHNWYSGKEMKVYYDLVKNQKYEGKQHNEIKRKIKEKGYYNLPSFLRANLYFIYRYYFRLGFLDGTEGRIFHFLQGYWYRFLVDAKIFEEKKRENI